MAALQKLYQPIRVGTNELTHRAALAPLTRTRATDDHVPTDLMREYYVQRSSTPGTLLITEATPIADKAGGLHRVPGIWNQAQIDGWKKITDAVHEKGCFIWVQLWAMGRAAQPDVLAEKNAPCVAPSPIPLKGRDDIPHALTIPEIKEYVELFGTAATNALKAGFDGVEIHGANGYLVDQFLQTVSNERADEYGGSIENRIRFADEVVDAVIAAVGPQRSAIRLSPWSVYQDMCMPNPVPTFEALVKRIDEKHPDLAYIHVVEPDAYGEKAVAPGIVRSNDFVDAIRLPRPVVHTNGFDRELGIIAAERDGVIIGYGRAYLANPDLPKRLVRDWKLNEVDFETLYGRDHVGYTTYPFHADTEVAA